MYIKRYLGQIDCQNTLGEGVLYHPKEHALYWTDIQNKRLHICRQFNAVSNLESTKKALPFETIDLPHRLASFAFTQNEDVIVAAFDIGIALYHLREYTLTWLSQPELDNTNTRFNDGRSDPKGRFWAGTMLENGEYKKLEPQDRAALYCVYFDSTETRNAQGLKTIKEHSINVAPVQAYNQRMLGDLHISNGLCFNEDASLMYHADSPTHKIYRYTLDDAGQIIDQDLFAKFEKTHFPDGAIVDRKGNVWTALWGGACIACINPEGQELFRYPLPVVQGSCVCIGGPNMNLLFVTSAQDGLNDTQLSAQPRAGNVLIYELSEALGRYEPLLAI
jgi:sugar lactone lactonase YvrE